jgi:hypothetical protein
LDDTFHHHPKPMQVSLSALGLFALGLSYSADNGTRGRLPEKWVLGRIVGDDATAPQQLVDAGLWDRDGGEFVIHDFHDYNLSPEELEAKRAGSRERKRRQRDRERESSVTEDVTPGTGTGSGSGAEPGSGAEFGDWLEHYRICTGRVGVRGSKPAREAFAARRKEGRSLDELKLATIGCHGDDFCREHGHDVPETILRASKVERYIQLAQQPPTRSGGLTAELQELEVERQRLLAQEGAGAT